MAKKHPTMDRSLYEAELLRLQAELVEMQEWVRATGARVVVIFEGRDAAGKGGAIKRITEYLNPRIARVVALPVPTERERTQWYFQRYIAHLPAAGEICLFDRSWYNRGGVEHVWEDYSRAKDEMFVHTDIDSARWHVVESADKRKARLNMIHHLLESIPYEHVERPEMTFPKKSSLPTSGYRRTDRSLQSEVPDYAATLSESDATERYVDLEDQGIS